MKSLFEAELDFIPPPKSNRYLATRSGKRFLPGNIAKAIEDTIFILKLIKKQQRVRTIKDYVYLKVLFILPDKRKRDLDNIMKTLGDCLEEAKIIENDNLIAKQLLEKALSTNKKARTIIKIYPYKLKKVKIWLNKDT